MCKRTSTFQSCKLKVNVSKDQTNSTISGQNCENTKLFKFWLLVVHIEEPISHLLRCFANKWRESLWLVAKYDKLKLLGSNNMSSVATATALYQVWEQDNISQREYINSSRQPYCAENFKCSSVSCGLSLRSAFLTWSRSRSNCHLELHFVHQE